MGRPAVAIYHLNVKILSRANGDSTVAAGAYRAGERLRDLRTGITHDYTAKHGIAYAQILAPAGAPDWMHARATLWNTVEAIEKRKDAQLARHVELALPVELDYPRQRELVREFVQRQFVAQGMVADIAIHRDNPANPHAHVLLTMRRLTATGFGAKERSWNQRSRLRLWRVAWEEAANEHLARAGLDLRIDHRTLAAQGIALEPGRKIGVSRARQAQPGLPEPIAERVQEQARIAHDNGERILADPRVALEALTHGAATFSRHDLARYLHTRTQGAEQFQAALLKVMADPQLVLLGRDEHGAARYSTRVMLALEAQLLADGRQLAQRAGHAVTCERQHAIATGHPLSAEQRAAFEQLTRAGDLTALVGVAGSGKSRLLTAARQAWEGQGYHVHGTALSGIAAENLARSSGIPARTLASFEYAWSAGRDQLTPRDVLVLDEAGMVGTRQFARVLAQATQARAKVVIVGDPEQLQAIEAGAPLRGLLAVAPSGELHEVRRQRHPWQQAATQELATGHTAAALARYAGQGGLIGLDTRAAARAALLARWAADGQGARPPQRLILAYTRAEVAELNQLARAQRHTAGELGREEAIETTRGPRTIAVHDRLYFLRNEKSLGVRNGTLGTVQDIRDGLLWLRVDGRDAEVIVDTRFYRDLDYGYAATVHKAQGATVDRTYLLATAHYDRHTAYVALSRHREAATLFYAAEDFGVTITARAGAHGDAARALAHARLVQTLARARPKELAHDYLEALPDAADTIRWRPGETQPLIMTDEERRALGAKALARDAAEAARAAHDRPHFSMDDIDALQQQAAARWLAGQHAREHQLAHGANLESPLEPTAALQPEHRPRPSLYRGGADEDLDV